MLFDHVPHDELHPLDVIGQKMGHPIGIYSVGNHGRRSERSAKGLDLLRAQSVSNVRGQDQTVKLIRFDKII